MALEKYCEICDKKFKFVKTRRERFCSKECYRIYRRTKDSNLRPKQKCIYCGKLFSKSRYYIKRGEGKFCSAKCMGKYNGQIWKKNPELSPNWKGGIENSRVGKYWEIWRRLLLKRDNKQCQICSSREKLQAHHIFKISESPELQFDLGNGIILCKKCHLNILGKEEEKQDNLFLLIECRGFDPEYIKMIEKQIVDIEL